MTSCNMCGATWQGKQVQHCVAPGCHKLFTSTSAGDRHRTGEHHVFAGPDRRRCMDTWEMEDAGMVQNSRGHWMANARDTIPDLPVEARSDDQPEAGAPVHPAPSRGCVQYDPEVD